MEIILDPDFFLSLITTIDLKTDNYQNFETFLSRLKNFKLIVKSDSKEDFYSRVEEDPYLELLINSSPLEINTCVSLSEEIRNPSFYLKGSPFKLFFLNGSAIMCEEHSANFGYEYISPENFEKKWSTYNTNRSDLSRKVSKNVNIPEQRRFDSWETLEKFTHPVNCILINDSHILDDQPNQPLRVNLIPLLKILGKKSSQSIPLEIIIFADPAPARQLDLKKAYSKLTNELNSALGFGTYNLNLIKYSKHSRFIITNYFVIRCENCFNLFKKNGELIKDTPWINFQFLFNSNERELLLDDLRELKEKALTIENSGPDAAYEIVNFYPGKSNRIMN